MRHHQQRHLAALQIVLQPFHNLDVKVVGGLVQDNHVRFGQQHLGQRHALGLAAGELADGQRHVVDSELAQHLARHVVAIPFAGRQAGGTVRSGVVHGVQFRVEGRLLFQIAYADAVAPYHRAGVGRFAPCKDVQEGGFARAVACHKSHFLALVYAEANVAEQHPVAVTLGQPLHLQITYAHLLSFVLVHLYKHEFPPKIIRPVSGGRLLAGNALWRVCTGCNWHFRLNVILKY